MAVIEGKVIFNSSLTKTDVFNGQDTGRYTVWLALNDKDSQFLEENGVKLKVYGDTMQRKFASKYRVPVIDTEDNAFTGEIPRGSVVRVSYKLGPPHPVHGTPTYLNAIRVLELGTESSSGLDEV